ncbi:cold shock domain-containing protein (plasmid) [Vibrio scophthalmi]|uniref:cold shock domain-containing protein n=1 Tax=Vibrio scophthalmi TaxID=45658 RepID=UPI003EBB6F19
MQKNKIGVVKWFDIKKGHGFINELNPLDFSLIEMVDYFVHHTVIESEDDFKLLRNGELVQFQCEKTSKGYKAILVTKYVH